MGATWESRRSMENVLKVRKASEYDDESGKVNIMRKKETRGRCFPTETSESDRGKMPTLLQNRTGLLPARGRFSVQPVIPDRTRFNMWLIIHKKKKK